MGLDVYSRREYKQGRFVYLLDDDEKTAWIKEGHIGRCRRYRLPDHVMIDGERYTVESVELGAYNYPRTLRHLVIPDTFVFVDCDTLYGLDNLRSVHIGKPVEELNHFNFRLCPKLNRFAQHIDRLGLSDICGLPEFGNRNTAVAKEVGIWRLFRGVPPR